MASAVVPDKTEFGRCSRLECCPLVDLVDRLGMVSVKSSSRPSSPTMWRFDIVHRTGKSNANADALSRRGTIGDVREQFRVPEPTVMPSEIRESYRVR